MTKWFKEEAWPCLKNYIWNLVIALDQILNAALFGSPDETFSARVHRKAEAGKWCWKALRWVINQIFFWQEDHCRQSFDSEVAQDHRPKEYQA